MFVNVLVIAITMFAAVGLVATQPWHGRFSMDNAAGVQNHHKEPTSRIGGVAIALGLVSSWVLATPDVRTVLGPMLLAGIPAFLFGLLEDLTKQVQEAPGDFHPGVLTLLEHSGDQIQEICGVASNRPEEDENVYSS